MRHLKTLLLAGIAALAAGAAHAADFSQVGAVENAVGLLRWTTYTFPYSEARASTGTPDRYEWKGELKGHMDMSGAMPPMPLPPGARIDTRQRALADITGINGVAPFYVIQRVVLDVEKETAISLALDVERLSQGACRFEFRSDGNAFETVYPKPQGARPPHTVVTPKPLYAAPGKRTIDVYGFCWPPRGGIVGMTLGYLGETGFVPFDKADGAPGTVSFGRNRGEVVAGKPAWKVVEGSLAGDTFGKAFDDALIGIEKTVEGPIPLYDAARQAVGQSGAKAIRAEATLRPSAVGTWHVALTEESPPVGNGHLTAAAVLLIRDNNAWRDLAAIAPHINTSRITAVGSFTATEADVAMGRRITLLTVGRGDAKPGGKSGLDVLLMGPGETRYRPVTVEITAD